MSQLPTNLAVEDDEEEEQLRVPKFGAITDAMMDALARSRRRQRSQVTDVMMDARNSVLKQSQDLAGAIKDQLEQELPEGQDRVTDPGTMSRVGSAIMSAQRMATPFGQMGMIRDKIIGGERASLLGKSFLRMGVQLQSIPLTMLEGVALHMRKGLEIATGRFIPVGSFEERLLRTRDEMLKLTQGDTWLAPKVQDRIFAWDDGDWWAERAGEQAAILLLTLGAGFGAGSIAGAATSRLALLNAIRVGAAASTTAMIEGGLALPEFTQGLMERGFTRSEARQIAQGGAVSVGIVNGFLDIAPLSEFLNKGHGRAVIVRAFLGVAKEASTEIAQEAVQIFAERRLKIDVPGTAIERMLAAGSVGMFAGGGVNTLATLLAEPLTPEQQRSKDRTELLRSDVKIIEAPVKPSITSTAALFKVSGIVGSAGTAEGQQSEQNNMVAARIETHMAAGLSRADASERANQELFNEEPRRVLAEMEDGDVLEVNQGDGDPFFFVMRKGRLQESDANGVLVDAQAGETHNVNVITKRGGPRVFNPTKAAVGLAVAGRVHKKSEVLAELELGRKERRIAEFERDLAVVNRKMKGVQGASEIVLLEELQREAAFIRGRLGELRKALAADVGAREIPAVADMEVDTPADVKATRQEIILQGEPRSEEQQEMLDATELQEPRSLKGEIQDFTAEELTQAREAFEDIIDSGLNPFTGSVMTAAEQAEMLLIIDDITAVRDTVESMPPVEEAAQVQTEELPDAQPSQQVEAAPAPDAAVVPAQARQEAQETEAEQVAKAQQEQDEDAPEPAKPVAEDLKGPLTQADQVRKLARAAFDRVASVAQGTGLQEVGARIGQLSQQIGDMLFEGNARRAGRLEPELEAAKAQSMRSIDDLERLHGDQGGLFDGARRWVRARGNSATAAVERLVNAVRNLGGLPDFDARVVEVDPESSKGVIQREVMETGLQLTFWESDTDVDIAGFHDRYGTGRRILINIDATNEEVLKTIIAHEMVHALQMSSQVAFERFYQRIAVVDPEGLRDAGRRYWVALTTNQATTESEFDQWFVSAEGKSESAALYVEERATNTDFYNKVLGTDKNLLAAFRDIIRRILNALRLTSAEVAVLFEMDQLASAAHEAFQKPPAPRAQEVGVGAVVAGLAEGRPLFSFKDRVNDVPILDSRLPLPPNLPKGTLLEGIRRDFPIGTKFAMAITPPVGPQVEGLVRGTRREIGEILASTPEDKAFVGTGLHVDADIGGWVPNALEEITETRVIKAEEFDIKPELPAGRAALPEGLPSFARKIPVTFVGVQKPGKGSKLPSVNLVDLPDRSTVSFDPAKHVITGLSDNAREAGVTEVPQDLLTAPKQAPVSELPDGGRASLAFGVIKTGVPTTVTGTRHFTPGAPKGKGGFFFSLKPRPEHGSQAETLKVHITNPLVVKSQFDLTSPQSGLFTMEEGVRLHNLLLEVPNAFGGARVPPGSKLSRNEAILARPDLMAAIREVDAVIASAVKAKGHDGIIYTGDQSFVVFERPALPRVLATSLKAETVDKLRAEFAKGKDLFRGHREVVGSRGFSSDPGDFGRGIYFTTSKARAKAHAAAVTKTPQTLKNPLVVTVEEAYALADRFDTVRKPTLEKSQALTDFLVGSGFDGLVVVGGLDVEVVVFPASPTSVVGIRIDQSIAPRESETKVEEGVFFHVTTRDAAHEIAEGGLVPGPPQESLMGDPAAPQQQEWPDGSTEDRIFFSKTEAGTVPFQREGDAAVLRVRGLPLKEESTGDFFSTKEIPASKVEILTNDGWFLLAASTPTLPIEQQQQIIDEVNGSFAFTPRPRGKEGETLRRVEAVTGVKKDTMSERDMKQLRKVLRQQQKAADLGFRGGVVNAQSKVLNVLEGVFGKMGLDVTERMIVRMQKARAARSPQQVAREGIRLMEGKISLVRHQLREDIRAKRVSVASIKRQVQEAVTGSLQGPIGVKMQGRFLGDVRKAETPAGLLRALRRIDRAIGQVRHREAVADLRKVQRKLKSFRPMTNEIRTNSALELTKARPHAVTDKNRVLTFKTRQEYDEATREVRSAVNEIEQMLSDRRDELKKINADKERTVQGHIAQVVTNIGGLKQLKGRSKMLQDIQSGLFKGLKLWHYDAANLTRHLEGKWDGDGVITALLDKNPKEVEEAYLSGRRDETDRLDKMIRESAVGSINLSDAQAKMSGSLGEANQEFVNVVIGGEMVTLSTDIVAELVAIDERTMLGIVEHGFQPEGARERDALKPTLAELQAIRQQWSPRFGGLIQGMKANLEVLKPQSYAVVKELTGTEPESEPTGYWPSHRNLRGNPDFGKPEDLKTFNQSAARRYGENLGFFKARTGGKSPFIMRGLISNYLDHVDNSLKVIHLAIPTRDAASVIMNPEVVQAINAAHGKAANEYLQGHLVEISRLNEDVDGGPNATLRATNSNLAGSWILTNVGTFIRQLGGISKIAGMMAGQGDFKWFLIGIKKLRPGTYQEMKDNSGVMWDRYEGDSAARYSSFRGQGLSGMDFAGFRQSLGGFLRSAKQLDGRSSRRSWTAMMRSIKFLDWFDSVSARLAWEGYKAKHRSQNPGWSEQQVMDATALSTANVVRSTQNTSSPLDSAGLAMRLRNNPMRVFLLFTTDPNKSLNQLVRGLHQGPKQGFYAATGVLGNIMWSSFAVNFLLQRGGDIAASAIAAALGRDIDEKEREKQRQRTYERSWIRMASEVFGLWFFGDSIIGAWEGTFSPFKRADVLRSPVGEVLADVANGIGDATRAVTDLLDEGKITEGEMTEFWKDTFSATVNLANAAAALIGNPFLTPYYRVVPIARQVFGDAVEETGRLKPSKPEL